MRKHTLAYVVVALGLSAGTTFAADFVKAKVVEVDQAARTVTLEHGDIPNLDMPGMTMTFRVGGDVDVTKLAPGEAIEFTADNVDDEITVTAVRARP